MARTLTWDDCLGEVRANNPDLISAKEQVAQSAARCDLARSNALPQINTSWTFTSTKDTGERRADTYNYGVTAKQLLFDGFKTRNDIMSQSRTLDAAHYAYAVTSSNVRLTLRTAFIDLLNAQESLKVANDIAARRAQNLDMITLQYQGGREHKGSLLTAKADLAQANSDIDAAKRDIALSQRRLITVMGWKAFDNIEALGALSQDTVDRHEPVFEDMIEQVPLLKELTSKKEAARYGAASAKSDFFPAIYGNASAGKSDDRWPPHQASLSAGLSLTFPIFQGGAQQAQLSLAKSTYAQAMADERSGRDGVLFTLAQTWTQWQDAVDTVEVQRQFLDAALERDKIAQVQYSSGLITFNDWTIIEDNLVSAQKGLLSALRNALLAMANWEQAKGVTVDE